MIIRKPALKDILQFVAETHYVENIDNCTLSDVENTFYKKYQNQYAHGHLLAFNYALNKLVNTTDYPSRLYPIQSVTELENNIHWIKKLYSITFSPLINIENYTLSKINTWRNHLAENTISTAPVPSLIPYIMIEWINNLSTIHNQIKDKLDSPYGISQQQYKTMRELIEQQPLFFSTVQPFNYANNRFGRLIQNIILIGWNMPLNAKVINTYETFKKQLERFQKDTLPTIKQNAQKLMKTIL